MCQVERVAALDALILKGANLPGLSESFRIPSRFNGPLESGNGGYSAGVVAGFVDGVFSRCFVCGRAREDAFEVFAGAVEGRQLVASPWTPPAWTADAQGNVLPEFVWAVLDCPTYFATYLGEDLAPGVLARFAARIDAPVLAGKEHVVMSWPIGVDGRKRRADAAVLSSAGEPLAVAQALLVEPRA